MANYLVTGGAGFLGSNLVRELVARGDSVTVLDSFITGKRENLEGIDDGLTIIEGDIRDTPLLLEIFASTAFESVFHLAALPSVKQSFDEPQETHDVNATGTLNVLSVARAVACPRIVFASSCAIYGDKTPPPVSEDSPANPLSPYAAQKLLGENYCMLYSRFLGVSAVALRFFNIYGPRQNPLSDYAAVVPRFLSRLIAGKPPVVFGDGEQTRDFLFVEDAVNACILASGSAIAHGKVINAGSGVETSVNELAGLAASVSGNNINAQHGSALAGEVRNSCADIASARSILAYSPETSLEDGLKKTFEFLRS